MDDGMMLKILTRMLKLQGVMTEALKKADITKELSTESKWNVYQQLDGRKSISEIAKSAGLSRVRVAQILPEWERIGIVISEGLGPSKRYFNLKTVAEQLDTSKRGV